MRDDMALQPTLAVPPQALESEAGLLGGLLLDNTAWDRVGDLLNGTDFYRHEHRLIFSAIAALVTTGKPADVITVHDELQRQGKADEVGGLGYLNSLAQYVPGPGNMRHYAENVREASTLRQIVQATKQAQALAMAPGATPRHAIEEATRRLSEIELRHGAREPQRVDALVSGFLGRLQDLADGRVPPGISTGLPMIDACLGGGFKPGRQVVIAARPSVGKSSLALQLAATVAAMGTPALFVSMEMAEPELMNRLVAHIGRVDLGCLTTGRLDGDQWHRATEALDRVRTLPLHIFSDGAMSLAAIRTTARRAARQHGVHLLVIDYLQLCAASAEHSASNRHHQLEELSRGLKALAMELGLTTLVLSQLNREVEKRTGGRPQLADLKESGSIEEDADAVLLLSRDGMSATGTILIHAEVAKSRGGRTGGCRLAFDGAVQHWAETQERPEQITVPTRHLNKEI